MYVYRHVCISHIGTYGVTIILYITVFTHGYNHYNNDGTIRNIYTKSLNAFIIICEYLHKFASCMVLFTFIRL